MYANDSGSKKASSDIDQQLQLGAHVDGGPEHLLQEVAETANGDELDYRPNRGSDSRGNYYARQNDYDWTRSTDVAPDRRHGETLAAQEQRHGENAEQARHSKQARDAHDEIDREASARQLTTHEQERPDNFEAETDPRADMDADALAAVNQDATTVSDQTGISTAAASRLVASHTTESDSRFDGVFGALTAARAAMNAPVPVADMNPHGYEATIEGTVTHLIEDPAASNQYQVAYVEDDNGDTAKVTVWVKSVHGGAMVRTLHEGDRVRICGGKPGEYNSLKTLAVTSKTAMCILERGDGPAPTGDCRASFGCSGESPQLAPWDVESDAHAWANRMDMAKAVEVTLAD
ncbi:single stranded DNA-binding domain-containing protein [Haloarcula amylovorans]|uniref:hypothetical protein n=1 Tax=Haloarcula amylovorans TaxID=2562280 RepID=UPI001075E074|nr:hypothetical protein [Halomicroarcula amylolytica]